MYDDPTTMLEAARDLFDLSDETLFLRATDLCDQLWATHPRGNELVQATWEHLMDRGLDGLRERVRAAAAVLGVEHGTKAGDDAVRIMRFEHPAVGHDVLRSIAAELLRGVWPDEIEDPLDQDGHDQRDFLVDGLLEACSGRDVAYLDAALDEPAAHSLRVAVQVAYTNAYRHAAAARVLEHAAGTVLGAAGRGAL